MVVRLNPFPRGGVRPERYLYGRSEQLDAIERLARGVLDRQCSDVLCFLAPAGLGKTCLLKLARRTFQQKGWLCGYSEASSDATTSILDLLSDAGEALPQEGIGAKFRARIQEFNVSAGPVGVGMKLGESSGDPTAYSRLLRLLTSLGQFAVQAGVGVALIIDEAQALPRHDLELLMRVISRIDDLPVAVLIGGLPKIPQKLIDGDDDARTMPGIWYHPLAPLTAEESRRTLADPAAEAECTFQPDALESLIRFAEGNPLALQMLGSAAWLQMDRSAAANETANITDDHARAAIDSVTSQLVISVYEPIWMGSTDAERAMLRAIARGGWSTEATDQARFTWTSLAMGSSISGLSPDEIFEITNKFAGNGMIYPLESMHRLDIRFALPGFGDYLIRQSGGPAAAPAPGAA